MPSVPDWVVRHPDFPGEVNSIMIDLQLGGDAFEQLAKFKEAICCATVVVEDMAKDNKLAKTDSERL